MSKKHAKEIIAVMESLYVINTRRFSQIFCLDFLGLYDIYIENSFVNKVTRWDKMDRF